MSENDASQGIRGEDNCNKNLAVEHINKIISELNNLITDINSNIDSVQAAETLEALNLIKDDLCGLPQVLYQKEFITDNITPLLATIELLSRTGLNLSTSVSVLTNSTIVPRKKGKIKDTIHTIYSINEECEDLYKVLKEWLKLLTINSSKITD